jgi:pilus assembly protein CpaE
MTARTSIILMSADPVMAGAVADAIKGNGHVLTGDRFRDLRELTVQLTSQAVPIALVDLDPQPQQVLPQLERLVARFPTTRFIALSSAVGNELLLEAMQTGVRRVVEKQKLGAELPGVLDRLTAAEAAEAEPGGHLVTILSAGGGCGATTIAVNLADELATSRNQPTLLWDLDCAYGAVSGYLGITPNYAADQILHYSGEIDGQLIRSTATVHSDRLHVLASPFSTNPDNPEPLRFEQLENAINSARRAYGITIVDAPRLGIPTLATLAASSAQTLLVLQLTVKDLRSARVMLQALRGRGIDMERVIPVASRFVKRQFISQEEAEKALGMKLLTIRNDFTPAIKGLNFGQMLAEIAPRSSVRRDLQELIGKLNLPREAME